VQGGNGLQFVASTGGRTPSDEFGVGEWASNLFPTPILISTAGLDRGSEAPCFGCFKLWLSHTSPPPVDAGSWRLVCFHCHSEPTANAASGLWGRQAVGGLPGQNVRW